MKICYRCKEEKEDEEFAFRKKELNIRARECKSCHSDLRKIHYSNNKDKILQQVKARKLDIKAWYKDLKKHLKCSKCEESHPAVLQFHHIDPNLKDLALSRAIDMGWGLEKIQAEINKCVILCANCHFKEHFVFDP